MCLGFSFIKSWQDAMKNVAKCLPVALKEVKGKPRRSIVYYALSMSGFIVCWRTLWGSYDGMGAGRT